MDENKEFNTEPVSEENVENTAASDAVSEPAEVVSEAAAAAENTAEETAENAQDTAQEAAEVAQDTAQETADTAFDAAAGTVTEATDSTVAPVVEPKKKMIMKPIIIAACIVVVFALAALLFFLFNNSGVEGTWHYVRQVPMLAADATDDEAVENVDVDYYFTFKGNEVQATIGTVTTKGTYTVSKNTEGKSVMTMDLTDLITSYNFLPYGEYELTVSGNSFTGRKLVLTTPSDETAKIEMESATYTAPKLEREGEFETNSAIVGKWVFQQEGYNLSYDIKSDGTIQYRENVTQMNMYTGTSMTIDYVIDGIYEVNDSAITMHFYYTKDTSMDITYQADGDTLYLNSIPFVKEGVATPAEAQ